MVLASACILALIERLWSMAFIAVLTFGLTTLPYIVRKWSGLYIPDSFLAAIAFFMFATIFLGEAANFYEQFWWWDIVLHAGSAIAFGLIGFVIVLFISQKDKIQTSPFWISILSFSFAIAIGTLLEIFEFAMDQLFGLTMQKSGLVDTMWDLIVDSLGAAIASTSGYFYLTKKHKNFLNHVIEEMMHRNFDTKFLDRFK